MTTARNDSTTAITKSFNAISVLVAVMRIAWWTNPRMGDSSVQWSCPGCGAVVVGKGCGDGKVDGGGNVEVGGGDGYDDAGNKEGCVHDD